MVNRVTEALVKFIKPIATSKRTSQQEKNAEEPQKKKQDAQPQQSEKHQHSSGHPPAPKDHPSRNPYEDPPKKSVTTSFLELLQRIQRNNDAAKSWLAVHTYSNSVKKQKKIAKKRKGAMLDEEIE